MEDLDRIHRLLFNLAHQKGCISFSSSLPFLSPHGHKSHSNPFAPDVLPLLSPGGLLCTSFRAILLRDGAGWHDISSRLSPRTWKHIQIYFQGPAWKIFDHALSNSNKWERGVAAEDLSLIHKVFQMRRGRAANKNYCLHSSCKLNVMEPHWSAVLYTTATQFVIQIEEGVIKNCCTRVRFESII